MPLYLATISLKSNRLQARIKKSSTRYIYRQIHLQKRGDPIVGYISSGRGVNRCLCRKSLIPSSRRVLIFFQQTYANSSLPAYGYVGTTTSITFTTKQKKKRKRRKSKKKKKRKKERKEKDCLEMQKIWKVADAEHLTDRARDTKSTVRRSGKRDLCKRLCWRSTSALGISLHKMCRGYECIFTSWTSPRAPVARLPR